MHLLMTTASAPAPPLSGPLPAMAPRPDTLYNKPAAMTAWNALLGSTPGVVHHPTIAFHITDEDGWSFELVLWGQSSAPDGTTADAFTIKVTDEEGHTLGYL